MTAAPRVIVGVLLAGVAMTGLVANVHHNVIRNNRLYEESLPHGAGMAIGMNGDVHHNVFFGNDTADADSTLDFRAAAQGTFSSSTRGTGTQQATVTCTGPDCASLGSFPCTFQVSFQIATL